MKEYSSNTVKIEQVVQWELPVAAARLTEWLSKDEYIANLMPLSYIVKAVKLK